MPETPWLPDLPFPLDHVRLVRQAMVYVEQLRQDRAQVLLRWEPELDIPSQERARRELTLALVLVQTLGTGDGSFEARMRACQSLYRLGKSAPGEATRAGELLLRSRIVTGATDMETFWLAAAFAHPLAPLVSAPVAGLIWRYLTQAPFTLDPVSALEFAKDSGKHRFGERPRWPWEYTEALMQDVQHRELVIILLEAMLCALLKASSIEQAASKLPAPNRLQTPIFKDVVIRLSSLYIEGSYEAVYARDIAQQAATLGDEKAAEWVENNIFDVPYEELAKLVKAAVKGKPSADLEAYYDRAVQAGKFHVARRIAELELVVRMTSWKRGPMYPHIEEAIAAALKGEVDEDPRVRELLLRTGILYSRTRHYTPAAQVLLRRLSQETELLGDPEFIDTLREEFQGFVRACDPYNTLARASEAVEARIEELDADAKAVLGDVRAFLFTRVKPQTDLFTRSALALAKPLDDSSTLEALIEGLMRSIGSLGGLLLDVPATQREIALQAGVPWNQLHQASVRRLREIATSYSRMDRITATAGGAITGLMGGPWGAALDLGTLLTTAARAVSRIGLSFGIHPQSDAGRKLLSDSLTLAGSTPKGEGLVAILREEGERDLKPILLGGVLYSGEQVARWAPGTTAWAITTLARQLGFSWTEQRVIRFVPLLGAVLSAGSDYLFLRNVTDAATHLAARHFLMTPIAPNKARVGGSRA